MIRTSLVAFAAIAFAAGGAAAQGGKSYIVSRDGSETRALGTPHYQMSQLSHRAGTVIFSNLSPLYPKGVYYAQVGQNVTGSAVTGATGNAALAVQFTTANAVSATEIDAGITHHKGTNNITLALYTDDKGKPGTLIVSHIAKKLGKFGDCCVVAKAKIPATHLAKATPYWVVATASGDTWDIWTYETFDAVNHQTVAFSFDAGETWTAQSWFPGLSVQVMGQ